MTERFHDLPDDLAREALRDGRVALQVGVQVVAFQQLHGDVEYRRTHQDVQVPDHVRVRLLGRNDQQERKQILLHKVVQVVPSDHLLANDLDGAPRPGGHVEAQGAYSEGALPQAHLAFQDLVEVGEERALVLGKLRLGHVRRESHGLARETTGPDSANVLGVRRPLRLLEAEDPEERVEVVVLKAAVLGRRKRLDGLLPGALQLVQVVVHQQDPSKTLLAKMAQGPIGSRA
mmetsp:Transcript_24819/g.70892  ORF Transcript_24819/g.70892 Transcript_24819/m.70892 type:complete len:232 (+) Transcript_24819:852-1547(+)